MAGTGSLVAAFRPSVASLGYALFLAINATAVWGGVFPFLPLEIQSQHTMFWFFLVEASVFAAVFLASVVGSYFFPARTKRFLVPLASLPYVLGWVCLIAASYVKGASFPLVVCGGGLLGVGSAGFYMLWQRLFAAEEAERGNRELIVGTVYASVMYLALHAIPLAVTAILVPLVFLPLFGLAVVLASKRIDLNQPMFEDVPREHPQVYKRMLSDVWRSAVSLGGLGLCTGVMRATAITGPEVGSVVNIVSMVASFIAAASILVVWTRRGFTLNVPRTYRRVFPLVLAAFFCMPLVPSRYVIWLAGLLYALHSVAILVMMVQCAQISRDRGINTVFVYGLFGGIMYALHDFGFIMGTAVSSVAVPGLSSPAMVALATVCTLSLLALLGSTPPKQARALPDSNSIELVGQPSPDASAVLAAEVPEEAEPAEAEQPEKLAKAEAPLDGERMYIDRISKQVELLKEDYHLTSREAEVAEYLARGETVARTAEALFISENTVRMHSKRIYAKLDIHKKQELRDLVSSY